jgi:hypothetical protein
VVTAGSPSSPKEPRPSYKGSLHEKAQSFNLIRYASSCSQAQARHRWCKWFHAAERVDVNARRLTGGTAR